VSKGTKRYTVRFDDEIMAQIVQAINERNMLSPKEPWTLSDWLRIASTEKLDKVRRGRKQRGGVRHPPARRVN